MTFDENPLTYLKRPSKDGAHGRMTSQTSFMRKKIISYSVIQFSLCFPQSGVWLLGDHNRGYTAKAIYVYCGFCGWAIFMHKPATIRRHSGK
jgi:hypothetical protein